MQRPHQRRVIRDVEDVEPIPVPRRIHDPVERVLVRHLCRSQPEDRAHRLGDDFLRLGRHIPQARPASVEAGVEFLREAVGTLARQREPGFRHVRFRDRRQADFLEEIRVPLLHQPDHLRDHLARLVRRVAGVHHPMQPVQDDARHGVHHRGEGRNRDHVAGRLDRALLGVLLDLLQALGIRVGADVAQLFQNAERIVLEDRGQLSVAIPGAHDGVLVDVAGVAGDRRHKRARLFQLHVALTGLLGVVERIRVQERPDELPGDVLEPELEIRVLIDRVVTGVKRQRADRVALLVGDFRGSDHARRVARTRRSDRAVERRRRGGSKCDDWRTGGEHWRTNYKALGIFDLRLVIRC